MTASGSPGRGDAQGWAFLVAPGRHLDHTVLVAPDFLVAGDEHGILLDRVKPGPPGEPPRVATVASRNGPLTLVYSTHELTAADLQQGPDDTGPPCAPRDEHNRPLRFIFGHVSQQPPTSHPRGQSDPDLQACRAQVLAAYRQFLADEAGFRVVASQPIGLRGAPGAPGDGHPPAPSGTAAAVSPLPATPATRPASRPRVPPSRVPGNRLVPLLGVLAVAAGVVVVLVLLFGIRHEQPASPCPTSTAAGRPIAAGSASPTCPPSAATDSDDTYDR